MIREALLAALDDEVAFDKWFGAQVTRWGLFALLRTE